MMVQHQCDDICWFHHLWAQRWCADESALIIADFVNYRFQRFELTNNSVTTIAGSSTYGGCGWSRPLWRQVALLLIDAVGRFVAIERHTATAVMTASYLRRRVALPQPPLT